MCVLQTKWHKGETCHKNPCAFLHKMCDTKKEWDELFKPWEMPGRARSQPKSLTTPIKTIDRGRMRVLGNYGSTCRKGLQCPNANDPSKCNKLHIQDPKIVVEYSKAQQKASEGTPKL